MAEYVLQFESRAKQGRDAEFNKWYDETHMADVLNVPGFKSVARYTIIDPANDRPHYIAAYTVDCDDPFALLGRLAEASVSMEISPTIDLEHVRVVVLQPR